MTATDALLEHERLMAANRICATRLAQAYGLQLATALEQPTATFVAAREQAETRLGVRIWKFYWDAKG